MTRFSVGEDDMERGRKRKQRSRGVTETSNNREKARRNGEEEAMDGDSREVEDGEQDEGSEEIEGGGEEERDEESSDSTGITVKIDPDVLDCSICYEPLRPPLFQCLNGHLACSSCYAKLLNKCHICSNTIGYSRCLALEKVIESIKIVCSNAEYGCKRTTSYSRREAHADRCIYSPCFCPILNCSFRGSTRMLSDHFSRYHHHSTNTFWYDRPFKVSFRETEPFLVLHGEDGHLFLLLNDRDVSSGHALSISCIRPSTLEWNFVYQLTAKSEANVLQMKASTTNICLLENHTTKVFLMIPTNFFPCGKIFLDICIQKVKLTAVS